MDRALPLFALLALCACRTDKDDSGTPPGTCTWYADQDGDSFGDTEFALEQACSNAPSGYVDNADDCDDSAATVHPGADELCDLQDNDCDGETDEDPADAPTWYPDADGDLYGADEGAVAACEQPEGTVAEGGDCDDEDPETNPSAAERCDGLDNDCDGLIDDDLAAVWYEDGDGDGWGDPDVATDDCDPGLGWVADGTDCDDQDPGVFPGATETCDGRDEDCDGELDEDLGAIWFVDADGDGYGDPAVSSEACDPGPGWVEDALDCDDANSAISPAATEVCNGYDDDCDGLSDDEDDGVTGAPAWYEDSDGDGWGVSLTATAACDALSGQVALDGDCDDADPAYNPGAAETDCADPNDYNCDGTTGYADADADGFAACEECDDADPAIFPGAIEVCDGLDDDCDGTVDEGDAIDALAFFGDADGDGWGNSADLTWACTPPAGSVPDDGDCDDTDPAVSPGAAETCDGRDEDCDGDVDEGLLLPWYQDADGDGYGDPAVTLESCEPPSGWVADASDCADADASAHPGGIEVCGGGDEDCDGLADDADPDVTGATPWYPDGDGDGYGFDSGVVAACAAPAGAVAVGGDCDDGDPAFHPSADESDCADPHDYNCDGLTGYADADRDGWAACEECDDADPAVFPGATETCDGVDDDCDGLVDEPDALGALIYYADADADGFGDATATTPGCTAPAGYVADATDCDDADPAVSPGAPEHCDGTDEDCDGSADEGAIDASIWYRDADRDGYGSVSRTSVACTAPSGYVAAGTDCDDGRSDIHPGASETCDGADEDCDGAIDEGALDRGTWYDDADGDGYGDPATAALACTAPSGFLADGSDCDDGRYDVHPRASESCNGYDDDCDGATDEADAIDISLWYADADADGYGDPATSTAACTQPSGTVADHTDCDDDDATSHPRATEVCDDADNDCDGSIDEGATAAPTWYRDRDTDGFGDAGNTRRACDQPSGYVADATDCDDGDATDFPGADEWCDGEDNDCDGDTDEVDEVVDPTTWYPDDDADGYGSDHTATDACEAPSGYVADGTDCDDTEDRVHPGADDVCDGLDNDCDGVTDPDPEPYDADGDGIYNCLDSTIYSYNFNDGAWTGWTWIDLGGGNVPYWSMSGGTLHEASNAALSIAYGPDLGDLYHYAVTVDVAAYGAATNGGAIVLGYEDSGTYVLARWLDPNDYYGSYPSNGHVDLYVCDAGSCWIEAEDDGSRDLSRASGVWIELAVEVDDEHVAVVWDGIEVVSADLYDLPVGAAHVGVWTFDNDGGIYYDNFSVTGP